MDETNEIGFGTILGCVAAILMPIVGFCIGVGMFVAGHGSNGSKVMLVSVAAFFLWLVLLAGSAGA